MTRTIALAAALAAAGCASSSRTRVAPGATSVATRSEPPEAVFRSQRVALPDGTQIESLQRGSSGGLSTTTASARGAGVDTTSDEIGAEFRGTAPSVSLPDGPSASGGDADSNITARGFNLGRVAPLHIVGGLLIAAGVGVALVLKRVSVGVALGGAGVLIMLMAAYPTIAVVALVLAAAGAAFWLLRDQRAKAAIAEAAAGAGASAARYREALRAVVAGVASAPEAAKSAVKAEVAKQVDPQDQVTIAEIKQADGL